MTEQVPRTLVIGVKLSMAQVQKDSKQLADTTQQAGQAAAKGFTHGATGAREFERTLRETMKLMGATGIRGTFAGSIADVAEESIGLVTLGLSPLTAALAGVTLAAGAGIKIWQDSVAAQAEAAKKADEYVAVLHTLAQASREAGAAEKVRAGFAGAIGTTEAKKSELAQEIAGLEARRDEIRAAARGSYFGALGSQTELANTIALIDVRRKEFEHIKESLAGVRDLREEKAKEAEDDKRKADADKRRTDMERSALREKADMLAELERFGRIAPGILGRDPLSAPRLPGEGTLAFSTDKTDKARDAMGRQFAKEDAEAMRGRVEAMSALSEMPDALSDVSTALLEIDQGFRDLATGGLAQFTAGMVASIDAAIAGEKSFGRAMREFTRATLAGIAQQAAVKAIFELAEGWAALGNPVMAITAPAHFKAAALYGGIAAVSVAASGTLGAGLRREDEAAAARGGSQQSRGGFVGGRAVSNAGGGGGQGGGPQQITVVVQGAATERDIAAGVTRGLSAASRYSMAIA